MRLALLLVGCVLLSANDVAEEATDHRSLLGFIEFVSPPEPIIQPSGVFLAAPHVRQPLNVAVNVKLSANEDFSDWQLCYWLDEGSAVLPKPFCVAMILDAGYLRFSPLSSTPPPEFDSLSQAEEHMVVAWFSSISSQGQDRWGMRSCPFTVSAPTPKYASGASKYIADDGDFEEDEGAPGFVLVEGKTVFSRESTQRKTTPTVCGVIVEPRNQPIKIATVIRNLLEQLPMVRPVHLFHGSRFDPCSAGTTTTTTKANTTTATMAAVATGKGRHGLDQQNQQQRHPAASVPPPPSSWFAALSVKGAGRVSEEEGRLEAELVYLCGLVEREAVVLHPLTVDNLTFREYNRLLKSKSFWSRLIGSDKALVFQTDVAFCSGGWWGGGGFRGSIHNNGTASAASSPPAPATAEVSSLLRRRGGPRLIRDFASKLDYVGSRQNLQYFEGSPPRKVEGELLGGNGGLSLRDIALSVTCATDFGAASGKEAEDNFFPRCIQAQGGRVASKEEQSTFSSQSFAPPFPSSNDDKEEAEGWVGSLGAHKPHGKEVLAKVLAFCPEYQALLDLGKWPREEQRRV